MLRFPLVVTRSKWGHRIKMMFVRGLFVCHQLVNTSMQMMQRSIQLPSHLAFVASLLLMFSKRVSMCFSNRKPSVTTGFRIFIFTKLWSLDPRSVWIILDLFN